MKKKAVLLGVVVVVVAAWLSMIPGYYIVDGDKRLWAVWVTGVALATEAGFWIGAATLGMAAYEARRKLWRWLSGEGAA